MTETATRQIFHDHEADRAFRPKWYLGRLAVYSVLIFWTVVCLGPIFWTITTSFKAAPDVMQGNLVPWVDYQPQWLGWRSLGLSPETITEPSTVREQFMLRFWNSAVVSVGASLLALILGSLAAYGLSRFEYRFGPMKNDDISFFFLSQLILPPVVLALPFLVLYREVDLLDTQIGLILLYTLTVMPIVIWIMRDQFGSIPTELEEAALVDGLSIWGAFVTIILPIALPGHGRGVHPLPRADMERVFLRRAPDLNGCGDAAGDGRLADGIAGDQLVVHGRAFDGGDPAAHRDRHRAGALHHQGHGRRRGEVRRRAPSGRKPW
jgi:multiple sugar transport system permease protein